MLQQNARIPKSTPPVFDGSSRKHSKNGQTANPAPMAIDAIRADIAPLEAEPDLLNTLCQMAQDKQTRGMVALFDGFRDIATACQAIENEPRSEGLANDYMEAECLRAWSKAYMVADFLKDQPVDDLCRDEVGRVLLTCALMMGHGIKHVAKIAAEFAELPDGFERSAKEMQPSAVARAHHGE